MQSKFKVGDKVTVIHDWLSDNDTASDYPCRLTKDMLKNWHDQVLTISQVYALPEFHSNCKYCEEMFYYRVKENECYWSSPMFVKIAKSSLSIF